MLLHQEDSEVNQYALHDLLLVTCGFMHYSEKSKGLIFLQHTGGRPSDILQWWMSSHCRHWHLFDHRSIRGYWTTSKLYWSHKYEWRGKMKIRQPFIHVNCMYAMFYFSYIYDTKMLNLYWWVCKCTTSNTCLYMKFHSNLRKSMRYLIICTTY